MNESTLQQTLIGKTVKNIYKEKDDNYEYWVVEFENGGEVSIKFMLEVLAEEAIK